MEDGQPTSTPTPCKMGCGFFVSLRYSSRFFPFVFPASPRFRVVAESVRPLLSRVTSSWLHVRLAQEIPKPSGAFLASSQVGEDDPRRRGCTIHGGGGHGGKAHFQTRGRSLSVIRGSGRTVLRVSEPIVLTHNTGRIVPAWGRVERGLSAAPSGRPKGGIWSQNRTGIVACWVGALDSIHSFRSFSFARRRRISLFHSSVRL